MFPKLRFKEFDGDLTESKLVELTSWASGGTPAKDVPEYWGDGIPLISGASMHTNQLYESDVKITKLGLQKGSKLALKDSILILVRGSMLFNKIPMGITLGDVAFNQDVKCIRPKQQLAPLFLFQWLHAKENTIQNKVTATGIGAGKLDTADLQNLKLYKPSLEEQTKIATFLSAVDEKISQLTQKHQLLREYKQGMMQKLFSQQIRFRADDGSEFGEWEGKELHQIFQIKAGGDIEKSSVSEVRTSEFSYPIFANSDKNKGFYGWANKFKYKEAVTVTGRGNLGIAVARNEPFYPIVRLLVLLPLVKQNLKFFEEQINLLDIVSESTGVPQLTAPQLSKYKVNVPSLEEQTKIANFLSSIDQKIEVVAQQIEQAKQWKKGLLQQMFI